MLRTDPFQAGIDEDSKNSKKDTPSAVQKIINAVECVDRSAPHTLRGGDVQITDRNDPVNEYQCDRVEGDQTGDREKFTLELRENESLLCVDGECWIVPECVIG